MVLPSFCLFTAALSCELNPSKAREQGSPLVQWGWVSFLEWARTGLEGQKQEIQHNLCQNGCPCGTVLASSLHQLFPLGRLICSVYFSPSICGCPNQSFLSPSKNLLSSLCALNKLIKSHHLYGLYPTCSAMHTLHLIKVPQLWCPSQKSKEFHSTVSPSSPTSSHQFF